MHILLVALVACSGNKEPTTTTTTPAPAPPTLAATPAPTPPRDPVLMTRPLCADGEHVHFSCALPEARAVSLCGTPELGGAGAWLQLRVGLNPAAPEVQWPPGTERSVETFEGARSGGQLAVRTGTGRMGYEVFVDGDGGGYTLVAPNGTRTDHRCLGALSGDLGGVVDAVSGAAFWR